MPLRPAPESGPTTAAASAELGRARRILRDERARGAQDRLVQGGLAAYVRGWAQRIQAAAPGSAAARLAAELAVAFERYRSLPEPSRLALLDGALARLDRLAATADPARPAVRPPRPDAPAPAPTSRPAARPAAFGQGPARGPQAGAPQRDSRRVGDPAASRAAWGAPPPRPVPPATGAPPIVARVAHPRPARLAGPVPPLDAPITEIKGLGPQRARPLARLGIERVGDLLFHFPRDHHRFPPPRRAADLLFQREASFVGLLREVQAARTLRGIQKITATIGDETGSVQAVWFRAGYNAINLRPGEPVAISGPIRAVSGGQVIFEDPEWEPAHVEPVHTRRWVPIYPLTRGVSERALRELVRRALDARAADVPDPLPAWLRSAEGLLPIAESLRQLHYPDDADALALARRYFAFEELLVIQIVVQQRRHDWRRAAGRPLAVDRARLEAVIDALPFRLTGAQRRVLDEILADLAQATPMTRLLQGDVGSGKTAVAALALLGAVAAGAQGALMAPTEILAEQHLRSVQALYERAAEPLAAWLGRVPRVALLTGSARKAERERIYARAAAGEVDVLVGTQALIQGRVEFRDLALAIVDEQHRFGVRQRLELRSKGRNPHLLVMTATPIPRTLALSLYGDLDLSVLDELPPGRTPVKTVLLRPAERPLAYEKVRREVAQGRQAFVICPLVEDSDRLEARAATAEFERLQAEELRGLRLGLLHGRLPAEEKDAVMRAFRDRELDVLVSTAVVEVGVDVPNATVMLVEGAERFGLAQLHQFRGRVGRGPQPAVCILLTEQQEPAALERLQVVVECSDGLQLAERDLELRGPGDYFGVRQSGFPELKVASLADAPLVERARARAAELLARDPELAEPEHQLLARRIAAFLARAGGPS